MALFCFRISKGSAGSFLECLSESISFGAFWANSIGAGGFPFDFLAKKSDFSSPQLSALDEELC